MKQRLPFLLLIAILALTVRGEEVKPPENEVPLFRIYEAVQDAEGAGGVHNVHQGKLLLTVRTLGNLLVQADKESVRVVLNEADTKAFEKITTDYRLLLTQSGDESASSLSMVKEPRKSGSLYFGEQYRSGDMAAYIRKRFHFKPGTNDIEQQPHQQDRPDVHAPKGTAP